MSRGSKRTFRLSSKKQALLEKMLTQEGIASTKASFISPRTHSENISLSFAQQRMWLLHQIDPTSSAYNLVTAVRLCGQLRIDILEQCFQHIFTRHESLRTTFPVVDQEPIQHIAATGDPSITLIDVQAFSEQQREQVALQLVREYTKHPFRLDVGPLTRIVLIQLTKQESLLLLVMHHIISDGWSIGVLIREMTTLYTAYVNGDIASLPDVPIQYADFALWQRQWLEEQALQEQMRYWKEYLGSNPGVLQLPTDYPRSATLNAQGAIHPFIFPEQLVASLNTFCEQSRVTLFMLLLAAFNALLSRYTYQDDIFVGSPIANRNRSEIEGLIGFFVNTLVFRTRLTDNLPFRELLEQVRRNTTTAYDHQDVPFEQLVQELQPERDLSHTPLFQVLFDLNPTLPTITVPHLKLEPYTFDTGTAKFDITLSLEQTEVGLQGAWGYRTDLFEVHTIERMHIHFQNLLTSILADPDQPIGDLSFLTDLEQQQLLVDWNATNRPSPTYVTVADLVVAQAQQTPDAVALIDDDMYITYQTLADRVTHLAQMLIEASGQREQRVGVCVARSPDLIIGLLGVFKAGGIYVPLDPTYPSARQSLLIVDAQLDILLTHTDQIDHLPTAAVTTWCFEDLWQTLPAEHPMSSSPKIHPEQTAYLIYTSGSTGQPKGVLVPHRALLNHLHWRQTVYPLTPADRFVHKASMSFDIALWESLAALIVGGCTVLAQPGGHQDNHYMVNLLQDYHISIVHGSPSFLRMLVTTPGFTDCTTVRSILCGGESLPLDLHEQCLTHPTATLHHQYGPTETCIDVTMWDCVHNDAASVIPIGYPIANTQIYILDAGMHLVPIGVYGEIFVGGHGLAHGYLDAPMITAARFVPDPWSSTPSARLYRTGDMGRYRADGAIEFLGRIDQQIKLRGFRIEPGEIEATLRLHPHVQDTVVVCERATIVGDRLVAYIVPKSLSHETTPDWYQILQAELPHYMIPAVFVELEELPLTASGKIDHAALPAPDGITHHPHANVTLPRTPTEEVLRAIWYILLGVDRISIDDNFFALGGHSLLATQVIARIRDVCQVDIPVKVLFEYPTISALAAQVDRSQQQQHTLSRPPLIATARTDSIPLSFAQQRIWFLDQLQPNNAAYHIPMAIQLGGQIHYRALHYSFEMLIHRHEVLRTIFPLEQGQPVQRILPSLALNFPLIDLSLLPLSEQEVLIDHVLAVEATHPFSLQQGPLIRTLLIRCTPEQHVLQLTLHHIVSDGWSHDVLIRELMLLYQAYSQQQTPTLPTLPIQYADFAIWQRQWLQGNTLDTQLDYWKQQLAHTTSELALPFDRARPPIQTFQGAIQMGEIAAPTWAALQQVSLQESATLFMTLSAAWYALLYRYTGQGDICLGTPIANRTHSGLEELIGCFVNTLVLRVNLADIPTFRSLIKCVRGVTIDAYMHQDVPFEMVVDALQPDRDLSISPLFQVMLALQTSTLTPLTDHLDRVTVSLRNIQSSLTKFDLTLTINDTSAQGVYSMEYATDLFDYSTIERMIQHFGRFMEVVGSDPDQKIKDFVFLSDAEQHQLIIGWNATNQPAPSSTTVIEGVAAQAHHTPDAIALIGDDHYVTYATLCKRASHVAFQLQSWNMPPETCVGVFADRSIEFIVAVLGILQTGGTYVPLAPDYPPERLAFILHDAQVQVVLTCPYLVDQLPSTNIPYIYVDQPAHDSNNLPNFPIRHTSLDQLAYVIYTSGSTGTPKGVAVTHRGLLNLVLWHQETFALTAQDRATLIASVGFDASVWELWPYLTIGACIMIPPDSVRAMPVLLRDWLIKHQVSVSFMPTPLAEAVQEIHWPRTASLRILLTGGDVLHDGPVETIPFALVNNYGPTENTVVTTSGMVYRTPWQGPPSIGRAIHNTQLYVLDDHCQLTPLGVAGELFIGGVGLARGYKGAPSLTAERFMPHHFSQTPGARLYRTGDRVRFQRDGTLAFLGRVDHQVKIRGFRIELGEIEVVLIQQPLVQDAVVVVREDIPGNPYLVGYIIPDPEQDLVASELRTAVSTQLPDYMIPSAFVVLDTFPLTPNGKINRQALPASDEMMQSDTSPVTDARDPVEFQLLQILETTLMIPIRDVTSNFFELGGNSLLAVRLITEIEHVFGCRLPLTAPFQSPTIEQLADLIRQQTSLQDTSPLVGLKTNGANIPFICVHSANGILLNYLDLVRHIDNEQPVYGLQAPAIDHQVPPCRDIPTMAAQYIAALRTVYPQGPYVLGGWSFGGVVAFEMAQQLRVQGQEVPLIVLIDTVAPVATTMSSDNQRALETPVDDNALWLAELADSIKHVRGIDLELSYAELTQYDEQTLFPHFLNRLHAFGLLPHGSGLSQLQALIEVSKANIQAMIQYTPQIYHGPIALFRSTTTVDTDTVQSVLPKAYMSRMAPNLRDPLRGWTQWSTLPIDVHMIPGTHATMLVEPHVRILARQLMTCLQAIQLC